MKKKPIKMFYCTDRQALIGLYKTNTTTVEVMLRCKNKVDALNNQYTAECLQKMANSYNDSLESQEET